MKNIITAIGNTYIYEKIKNNKKYNIISKDIKYSDCILEILNENKNIDILLLSTSILEKKEFIDIIREKNEDIEIIIFFDTNFSVDIAYFNSKNIYKIYSNDKNGYDEYLKVLCSFDKDIEEKVKDYTRELKSKILEKNNNLIINRKEEKNIIENNNIAKIIVFSGTRGVREKYSIICFWRIFNKRK